MTRVREVKFHGSGAVYGWEHKCPGCNELHAIPTSGASPWTFNGDPERPTFHPSVLRTIDFQDGTPKRICHYFVTSGEIRFCGDCTHALAGKIVPLPEHP